MGWTLTVTDLNDYVRRSLAGDPLLQGVSLRGEISNFKRHVSGHLYFSLKDEQSRIQCVMFRQSAYLMAFEPRDGMRVVLKGSVSIYVASGSYQFYAESMTQDGVGDLYLRFEELKKRLMAEGLFDVGKKRPLPLLPRMVGVVTSRTGAVVHDIARVAGRRNPGVQLVLRPALVQGEGAKEDIAAGIRALQNVPEVDVIIVGRGGGSMEDLWAFNEELVVRAVAGSKVPVVSAVGHETDVTLSDFAADVRAATPSAAAELVVAQKDALLDAIGERTARLFKETFACVSLKRAALNALEKRLAACHPLARVKALQSRAALCEERLSQAAFKRMEADKARVSLLSAKLAALGPMGTLGRGYALVMAGKAPVTGIDALPKEATLLFKDGRAAIRTINIERGDPFGGKDKDV